MTTTTNVFKSNNSQAVRFPKAVALPESTRTVSIISEGNRRIITPIDQTWDYWFEGQGVSEDFMESRNQPTTQQRELL
jgi:antitoxin VapB